VWIFHEKSPKGHRLVIETTLILLPVRPLDRRWLGGHEFDPRPQQSDSPVNRCIDHFGFDPDFHNIFVTPPEHVMEGLEGVDFLKPPATRRRVASRVGYGTRE
jgi:hypothetical protein